MAVQAKQGTGAKPVAGTGGKAQSSGAPRDADELRNEIEQTRAEMGETVEALVAKVDVPGRVKSAAADKVAHVKESAAELKDSAAEKAAHVKDAAIGAAGQIKDKAAKVGGAAEAKPGGGAAEAKPGGGAAEAKPGGGIAEGNLSGGGGAVAGGGLSAVKDEVREKAAQIKESAVERGSHAKEAMTQAAGELRESAASGAESVRAAAMAKLREPGAGEKTHGAGRIAEATAQTSARMGCQAADAAERASAAIGSARRRVVARPREFALLGAVLAAAAAGVALIRRSR
ncbi:laminin subunit alpha-2 [Actinoplanes sp. SE50]|uniref:DUF3618 domain-containing protein n=1 Tax=unclassified Actinoplanes TaxID=2626549 RepID=UPI00023ED3EC|nr:MULTISPECIES: DUF3618 domain-containing protein [unclassified Actinoplanes]AEV83352.1 Laminin subunit alpha-2 [Actinoplanes sp. SE50/110]ATO81745.1 laminin subunit alpha-2 [Actinoplanes sp. SE50]SLL99153.1 laminin subunit alpha-2 [Actinoplanes sp. SE50/110]